MHGAPSLDSNSLEKCHHGVTVRENRASRLAEVPPVPATDENARPLRRRFFVRSWEYSHRLLLLRVRLVLGVVYTAFAIVLFSYGSWWGLAFLSAALAAFLAGYLFYQATRPVAGAA